MLGWHITSIGCSNTSIVISADDTLIAWGASPTYGELVRISSLYYLYAAIRHTECEINVFSAYLPQGLGDLQKSSSTPKEVSRMEGMKIPQVTMGMAHTLLLVNTDDEATNTKYEKAPEFDLDD